MVGDGEINGKIGDGRFKKLMQTKVIFNTEKLKGKEQDMFKT